MIWFWKCFCAFCGLHWTNERGVVSIRINWTHPRGVTWKTGTAADVEVQSSGEQLIVSLELNGSELWLTKEGECGDSPLSGGSGTLLQLPLGSSFAVTATEPQGAWSRAHTGYRFTAVRWFGKLALSQSDLYKNEAGELHAAANPSAEETEQLGVFEEPAKEEAD